MRLLIPCILLGSCLVGAQDQIKKHVPPSQKAHHSLPKTDGRTLPVSPDSTSTQASTNPSIPDNQTETSSRVERIEVVPQTDKWFKDYVVFTGIIALINFLVLIVIWLQRVVMTAQLTTVQKQLTEMQMMREQTVEQMKNASNQTRDLIQQNADQVAAAQSSAAAAKETVEAMRRSIRLDQRAWLSIEQVTVSGLKFEGRLEISIKITNTGRTPAKHANLGMNVDPVENGKEPRFYFADPTGGSAVIFPKGEYSNFGVLNCTPENLKKILSGEIVVWVYGKIVYEDIFGSKHWLKFCYSMNAQQETFNIHTEHNETDDNE